MILPCRSCCDVSSVIDDYYRGAQQMLAGAQRRALPLVEQRRDRLPFRMVQRYQHGMVPRTLQR